MTFGMMKIKNTPKGGPVCCVLIWNVFLQKNVYSSGKGQNEVVE